MQIISQFSVNKKYNKIINEHMLIHVIVVIIIEIIMSCPSRFRYVHNITEKTVTKMTINYKIKLLDVFLALKLLKIPNIMFN